MTTHLAVGDALARRTLVWRAACGPFVYSVTTTRDPDLVTCANCRRTIAYRHLLAEDTR